MHEIGLVKQMVSVIEKHLDDPAVGNVKTVHLQVGALRYVVPEILNACFKHVPKPKKIENAVLSVEVLPVTVRCNECDQVSAASEVDFGCKACGSEDVQICGGKEFSVKALEW